MKELFTNLAAVHINNVTDVNGNVDNNLKGDIGTIINAVIGVLGIVAVIIIIIGGVSYMTSSGDAGKVKKAKDIILYGVIGLIVCALAFAIVNFVIGGINGNSGEPTSTVPSSYSTQTDCEAAGYHWDGYCTYQPY